jgi:hypothetical protein
MADILDKIVQAQNPPKTAFDSVEQAFHSLGLNGPLSRAATAFLAVWGIQLVAKEISPSLVSFAYDRRGKARPWAYVDGDSADATALPWFALPALGAIAVGVFV